MRKRAVDAHQSTDKDFVHWKSRFKSGAVAFEQGKFAEARTTIYRSLMEAETLADKDFAVPASNIALGVVSMEQGNLKEAGDLIDSSLKQLSGRAGHDFVELHAVGLRLRAMLYERELQLDDAENLLRQSVDLLAEIGDDSSVQLAYSLCDLAFILVRNEKLEEAGKFVKSAISLLLATVGEDDPYVDWAKLIYQVRITHHDETQLCDAFELSAGKIQYKAGARHPNLTRTLSAYAAALKKRGLTERLSDAKEKFLALAKID